MVAESELTVDAAAGVEHLQHRAGRIGELQVRSERGVELRHHRTHAAGKIHADHLLVRFGGELGSGSVPPAPSDTIGDGVLRRYRIGVGELDGVARLQRAGIDAESRLAARA